MDKAKSNLASLRESASTAESDEDKAASAERYAKMEAQLAEVLEDNKKLKEGMAEKAAASAEIAIADAVKAGRIAPQDEATKAFWKSSILANPEAVNALNAIPVNPVLSGQTVLAGRSETAPQEIVELTGIAKVEAAFKSQQSK
jgi:hypothetical protein